MLKQKVKVVLSLYKNEEKKEDQKSIVGFEIIMKYLLQNYHMFEQ
jgi:hypothetical protein